MSNIEDDKKRKAQELMEKFREQEEAARQALAGDRDQIMIKHIEETDEELQVDRNDTFKNPDIPWAPTDKYRVAMLMPPSWSIYFPPYNLAKLTGLMRHYGYSVKVYDINVEGYHWFLENHGQDYWRYDRHFLWSIKDNFEQYLLPELIPMFDKIIKDLIDSNAKVVGLSLYGTSIYAGIYIAKRIRELAPDMCILAGGPETITNPEIFQEGHEGYNLFNYIFVGESEDNLINLLENLPEELPMNEVIGTIKSRLELENYPYADYSDYDIRNYKEHGVNIETSRGCIAKCSFCAETHFWKYRSMDPVRVVNELEHYVNTYKVRRFWFVDSLVNGHLKSFEQLIELLLEKKLNIKWHSMARCDGRMDYIFIRKAVAAGCTALAFGVESGSQKVLDDMRKKIKVWEIEANLRDMRKTGAFNHCTWMLGFPSEEAVDNFHNMQTLFNVRKWVGSISLGYTTGIARHSDIDVNYKLYGIQGNTPTYTHDVTFLDQWYTEGYKNTIVHRFLRLKFGYIWLEIMKDHKGSIIFNPQVAGDMKEYYTLTVKKNKNELDYIPQDFNVNFLQFDGTLSGTIAAEYVAMCYLIYKSFDRFTFTFKCDPENDLKLFGDYLAKNYWSDFYFDIDKAGNYTFILDHKLSHSTTNEALKVRYDEELSRGDMSFAERIEKRGHISEWQTPEPVERLTIHEQYRKKKV